MDFSPHERVTMIQMPSRSEGDCLVSRLGPGQALFSCAAMLLLGACDASPRSSTADARALEASAAAGAQRSEVSLQLVASLADSVGPYPLINNMLFAVAASGSIYIGSPSTGGTIVELSGNGTFRRVLGGTGSGPGESRMVTGLARADGDTLLVMDQLSRRLNRFDSAGNFVDATRLPGGIRHWASLGGKSLAVSGNMQTHAASGTPLHILEEGEITSSFGEAAANPGVGAPQSVSMHVASAGEDNIWAAPRFPYRVDLYSRTGEKLRTITRDVEWFPDQEYVSTGGPQVSPPPPQITGLYDDRLGRLWVYILVPDANWRPGKFTIIRTGPHAGDKQPEQVLEPFFDTIIDVIDIKSGEVAFTYRDSRMLLPVGLGHLASYSENSDGVPSYEILAHRLRGKPNSAK